MTETPDTVLGLGLMAAPIDPGGLGVDLVLTPGPDGARLATVAGPDNLAQCLRTALTTALGEDCFSTTFGFDGLRALTQAVPSSQLADLLDLAVRRALAADARVAQVLDVVVDRGADSGDPRVWTVQATVQTVAGTVSQLSDGRVAHDG